jgi:hypothetical protein
MAKVVNLNKFRKQKAKIEKEKRAETNRRLHGRTKAERLLEHKQQELARRKLDSARLGSESKANENDSGDESDGD